MTTEQILSEGERDARAREGAAFDGLAARAGGRIVVWGAGMLGRKVLAALRAKGTEPCGFADADPSLQASGVGGLDVLPIDRAVLRWGADALYVVAIFRPLASQGMRQNLRHLEDLGCRITCPFLPLAWKYPGILPHYGADLPSRILVHADALRRVAALWGDEASREIFRQQLSWRLHSDFSEMGEPQPDQYFPRDVIRSRPDERFVDAGAFDGDTLRSLPAGFSRAWAIEPDPGNAARLRSRADSRVAVFETALGERAGRGHFDALGSPASSLAEGGGTEVSLSALDDLLADASPTFLKLDVEGSELAALKGSVRTLRRAQPVVAVCLYHKVEDLWEIPLFLGEVLPGHRHFLRIHARDGFELVTYAIPAERCP